MTLRINILAGWLSHIVVVVIGFFLMPYILDTVGESQYGTWVFINAVAGYSRIIYAGFGATICRYVSDLYAKKEWNRMNQFVSSIQTVYIGTALLALLASGLFAWIAGGLDKWSGDQILEVQMSILLVGGTIGLGMIGSVYGGVLIGIQRIDINRGVEIVMAVVRLLLIIFFLQQEFGLITLSGIFLLVTTIEHIASAVIAYRLVPTLSVGPWNTRRDVLKECFGFSAFNAIALVAEYLIFFTDTVVIGMILGPLAVVPYQIGLRIAQMIQIPIAQVGDVILPKAGELHATQNMRKLGEIVTKAMGVAFLLAGGFYIGATYFGELLVVTWIGKLYPESPRVMVILIGAQTVALPTIIARKALLGSGHVRVPAFIDIAEAVCNLILSLIFIRYWGVIGVAWGTLIPLVTIELFVFLPYAMKLLQLKREQLLQDVVGIQIPALLALVVFCEFATTLDLPKGWIGLLSVTACGGSVLLGTRFLTHKINQITAKRLSPQPESMAH